MLRLRMTPPKWNLIPAIIKKHMKGIVSTDYIDFLGSVMFNRSRFGHVTLDLKFLLLSPFNFVLPAC
jgi:hypothetical protein